jgi:FMN-dependent oxidoreductase (nitrilotriacetate monooxygenase family)
MTRKRQIKLIGFLHAEHGSLHSPSWRHADAATDFRSPAYFQRIARTLEEGKFHMAFFDDRLAMPDLYGHSHEAAVAAGIRPVKMDPVPVLAVMAAATRHLGLGATGSTTYYEPFHIARTFQTLDLLSEGRAAWNVVTSLNDSEAANFGLAQHLEHDHRYDRADEFMQVVLGLWNSWEDDALIQDKAARRFADPKKVHALHHSGKFFRSRGPLPVPRSPEFCRALGRGDLPHALDAGGGAAQLRRDEGSDCRRRARSGFGDHRADDLPHRGRNRCRRKGEACLHPEPGRT